MTAEYTTRRARFRDETLRAPPHKDINRPDNGGQAFRSPRLPFPRARDNTFYATFYASEKPPIYFPRNRRLLLNCILHGAPSSVTADRRNGSCIAHVTHCILKRILLDDREGRRVQDHRCPPPPSSSSFTHSLSLLFFLSLSLFLSQPASLAPCSLSFPPRMA